MTWSKPPSGLSSLSAPSSPSHTDSTPSWTAPGKHCRIFWMWKGPFIFVYIVHSSPLPDIFQILYFVVCPVEVCERVHPAGHQWGGGGGGGDTGTCPPTNFQGGDIIPNVPLSLPTILGLYDYSLKWGPFFHVSSPALCGLTFSFFLFFACLLVIEVGDVRRYT